VEGTSVHPLRGEIVGIALSVAESSAIYVPIGHRTAGMLALEGVGVRNLPPLSDPRMKPLVDLLADESIATVGHDLKQSALALRRAGVTLNGIAFDTMLASYVLDPSGREHGLDALALQHFGVRT